MRGAAWVFAQQEQFRVSLADYRHIGKNPGRLMVFFSRMGYGKKLAWEEANRTGAAVCEIRSTERTAGTPGFWWCGRYGMHRWDMPIEAISGNLQDYEHVTICAPIWVFALAAPVRSFCRQAAGKMHSVDYILVHHTGGAMKTLRGRWMPSWGFMPPVCAACSAGWPGSGCDVTYAKGPGRMSGTFCMKSI